MAQLASLAAGDVRTVVERFSGLLETHREVINRLNVYPVPDGDTGTNMSLTVASVVHELHEQPASATMAEVCQAVAHGSLMGARGNSGVILSQLLRGVAETFRDHVVVDPSTLAEALARADRMARQAVVRPIEGTILSIARAAAKGAEGAADLTGLVRGARDASRVALERTPEQLAVLAQAGVVDAGGAGLCLLLDALCNVVAHDPLPEPPSLDDLAVRAPELLGAHHDGSTGELRYEVMYFLEAPDAAVGGFKDVWAGLGDSIVVVGGDGLYNCHIHTDDVGAAIEAALDVGRPRGIRVTDLAEQVMEERWVREGALAPSDGDGPAAAAADRRRRGRPGRRHRAHLPLARGPGARHGGPVDEPVHRRAPGRRARDGQRRGGAPAQQQEHHPGGRAGGRGLRGPRARRGDREPSWRPSRPCSPTTPTPPARPTPRRWPPRRPRRRRRGDPRGARRDDARPARSREGDWIGLTKHGVRSIAESVAVARAPCSTGSSPRATSS